MPMSKFTGKSKEYLVYLADKGGILSEETAQAMDHADLLALLERRDAEAADRMAAETTAQTASGPAARPGRGKTARTAADETVLAPGKHPGRGQPAARRQTTSSSAAIAPADSTITVLETGSGRSPGRRTRRATAGTQPDHAEVSASPVEIAAAPGRRKRKLDHEGKVDSQLAIDQLAGLLQDNKNADAEADAVRQASKTLGKLRNSVRGAGTTRKGRQTTDVTRDDGKTAPAASGTRRRTAGRPAAKPALPAAADWSGLPAEPGRPAAVLAPSDTVDTAATMLPPERTSDTGHELPAATWPLLSESADHPQAPNLDYRAADEAVANIAPADMSGIESLPAAAGPDGAAGGASHLSPANPPFDQAAGEVGEVNDQAAAGPENMPADSMPRAAGQSDAGQVTWQGHETGPASQADDAISQAAATSEPAAAGETHARPAHHFERPVRGRPIGSRTRSEPDVARKIEPKAGPAGETRADQKSETRPGPRTDSKPEQRPEPKSESKQDQRAEHRADQKVEARPEARSAPANYKTNAGRVEGRHVYEIIPRLSPDEIKEASSASASAASAVTAGPALATDLTGDGENRLELEAVRHRRAMLEAGELMAGVLEIMPDGYGFLRKDNYLQSNKDIYVPPQYIRRFNLRQGDWITGPARLQRETDRFQALIYIKDVNGLPPEKMIRRPHFDRLTPIYPDQRYVLETVRNELSTRIIDLVAPIGKGQRGMIVSPPKAGKTILLQKIANAISQNNPEVKLIVLLIDERPEEVTDMQRSINGEVVYSTFDKTPENHVKVTELVLERAMRLVELKQDVVILLDSMTRLARAYNLTINPTGRTLSGGLDPGALYGPKRFFGAARNIEHGGSLTIIATSLIETGSRMDEVIFEEFKGTGNMEVYLDRKLSEKRIFPAIDINRSGTRREELLLSGKELDAVWTIRKAFSQLDTAAVTETIINLLLKTVNNQQFISSINVSFNDKNVFEAMRGVRPGSSGNGSGNYGNSSGGSSGGYSSSGYGNFFRPRGGTGLDDAD